MTIKEIENTPELVDFILDKSVLADSRTKVYKRLKEVCDLAIKALEQEDVLEKIKDEIKDNTYFINETTEKEGIDFETVEKIIDKYKAKNEG